MKLPDYIAKVGDAKAGELFGVHPRVAQSWRLGYRKPVPRKALDIVRATHGIVTMEEIYGEPERASE